MTGPAAGRLRVDGATLHYEVRGTGPLVLLIPGGTGGAAAFDDVAGDLAADYTVASYDPRGLSRSPLDDPEAEQSVAQHADDALRLLDLLSPDAPARVVGCSSAALPPRAAARVERTMADMPYFLGRIVPSFMAYRPDLARLEALSDRLVLAAGTDPRGELPYRPAAFLAERFGKRLVHFPGGHTGLSTHPEEFGALLRTVLSA